MRVIVTGGTGLIGRALATELVARGDEVVVTTRNPEAASGLPAEVELARWDGASTEGLSSLLEGSNAVVHLLGAGVGEKRWTRERKALIRSSRVRSTAALTEALAEVEDRPAVLLQGSAIGYYGDRGDEDLDESSPAGVGFLSETCVEWEESSRPVEALGMRRVCLRTGVVLADGAGALPLMVMPFRFFVGGPLGDGRHWVPWIHIDDEVGAILHLLERSDARGAFNLTAPTSVDNRSFGKAVGEALRRPSFMPTPAFAMRWMLGEMSELVLGSQKALPRGLIDLDYEFRFPTLRAALRDLIGTGKGG